MDNVNNVNFPKDVDYVKEPQSVEKKKRSPFKFVLAIFLFLIIGVVGYGAYEYFRIAPSDVRFTNVTSSSVTVSWNTKSPTSATAMSFEGDTWLPLTVLGLGGERFYDSRDVRIAELEAVEKTAENIYGSDSLEVSSEDFVTEVEVIDMGSYYTHHVEIKGLDPETEYSFMIGDKFLYRRVKDTDGNNTVTTLEVPERIETPIPAYGSVKDAQGKEDIPIEELVPVMDGVVYFNYLDEFTGEKSTVYSGSLNKEGNWYIDVSMAVGEDGKDFLNRFDITITNILVELEIDAGELGRWKQIFDFDTISPTPLTVINDPLGIQDEEVGILRLDSMFGEPFIQGVGASSCLFGGFCGPCYQAGDVTKDCSCPSSTLKYRNCKGASTKTMATVVQEANKKLQAEEKIKAEGGTVALKCSGNAILGSTVIVPGEGCKVCTKITDNYAKWETTDVVGVCGNDQKNWIPVAPTEAKTATSVKLVDTSRESSEVYIIVSTSNRGEYKCSQITEYAKNVLTWPDGTQFFNSEEDCQKNLPKEDIAHNVYVPLIVNNVESENEDIELSLTNLIERDSEDECWEYGGNAYRNVDDMDKRMRCVDGKWIPSRDYTSEAEEVKCEEGAPCDSYNIGDICISREGEEFECNHFTSYNIGKKFSKVTNDKTREIFVKNTEDIGLSQRCKTSACRCSTSGSFLDPWEYCPEVSGDCGKVFLEVKGGTVITGQFLAPIAEFLGGTLGQMIVNKSGPYIQSIPASDDFPVEGKICSPSSERHTCQSGSCLPSNKVKGVENEASVRKNFVKKLVFNAAAETDEGNDYIMDSETGIFSHIELGEYIFKYQDSLYSFTINSDSGDFLIYVDNNNNQQYDDGDILITDLAKQIRIITVNKKYNYELKGGFNFVTLPFLISTEEYRTGVGLLTKLNEVYNDSMYSIAKYDGGRWRIVGQNTILYSNDDFQLLPGEGYIIKARRNVNISIVGQPIKYESTGDSAPITLFEGWNLIGLYGTGVKTYTAQSILTDINASNFTTDNVSRWEKEKQMYDGFQMSEGKEYGFDFPINSLESVFVRILEGRGKWQPKLRTQ